ncbi:MAG: hypothetical protein IPP72_12780 [Chitinophagaceae bacterium]|nr:hypothetical protein [Chitinophagaceae bacterium]
MKKLLIISCVALLAACNNAATTDAAKTDSTGAAAAPAEKKTLPDMPYTLAQPYQHWQIGDPQHAVTVMKGLKGYETGDIAACAASFGDSVSLRFDNYRARLSNDSLKAMFTHDRADIASMRVEMSDWESVISADKKEEWVTLWYKEVKTDKKGKTDSVSVVDDCKIENGKIVVLDEKIQHFPAPKK